LIDGDFANHDFKFAQISFLSRRCEANFYGAEYALLQNKKDEALRLYKLAAERLPPNQAANASVRFSLET